MAHFYATIQGSKGEASRMGGKESGIKSATASYQGCVRVSLSYDEKTGKDIANVTLDYWNGAGTSRTLYFGPVDGSEIQKENAP